MPAGSPVGPVTAALLEYPVKTVGRFITVVLIASIALVVLVMATALIAAVQG